MDFQSAQSISEHFARIARCADRFGYTRETLIEELVAASENYKRIAAHIERQMEEECV